MSFKIFDQDPNWLKDGGDLSLHSKDRIPGTELVEYKFKINSKNEPDDFLQYGGMTLISNNILDILSDRENVNADLFPVTMIWNDKLYEYKKFYVLLTVDELECIDYEKSKYKFFPSGKGIISLDKLVTYDVDIENHELFIIENTCFLCVADYIGSELLDRGCTGFNLIDVSEATI